MKRKIKYRKVSEKRWVRIPTKETMMQVLFGVIVFASLFGVVFYFE